MTSPFVSLEEAAVHMHQGVGPESLLQDGGAWGVVAQKLETAAEEILSVSTRCDEQYWQGPAAQQARDALTSVTQGLKNNAVVAGQIETAATTVAAAFNKAQGATPTPQHVADNRENRAWFVEANWSGAFQSDIAACDAAYEVMWVHSMTAYGIYYHDTAQALAWGEQTWWSPHQQPADASTTAGGHRPTHDAPDIPAQIEQHHDIAEWCRLYALNHAFDTIKHQEIYEQQSTYAKMCQGLADHGNATAELCNKLAQLSREAAQLRKDLSLGRADIPALAQKYVDIATTRKHAKQQINTTRKAYSAGGETQPHLQAVRENLSQAWGELLHRGNILSAMHGLDLENPDLHSYTDKLQKNLIFPELLAHSGYTQIEVQGNEEEASHYARAAARIQDSALHQAKEADNAWRAAHQHAQPRTDRAHDFVLLLQMAARVDNQATTLAGSSA